MTVQLESNDVWGLAAATQSAMSSGLLAALLDGPSEAATVAKRLGLDATASSRVLDVLVAAGVVEVSGGAYSLVPELLAPFRAFPGGLALTLGLFGATPEYLRTGRGVEPMDGSNEERAAAYRATVGGLARLFESAAANFAQALPLVPSRILDVGCGSGIWSLSVAERHPGARVTGMDLPGVLEVFAATATERGLAERIESMPGDMRETPLPAGAFDLVILANVLRLEPAARAAPLLARLAQAVRPGGTLVVVDALAQGTPSREVARAVYALHLALRSREATVHAPHSVRAWLTEAGIEDVQALDFGVHPGAVAALYGTRSAHPG